MAAIASDRREVRRSASSACQAYWKPVFKYLRLKWHAAPEDAADLTQGFFLRALEKDFFAGFDPARARFRTYLRTCLDGFVANARKAIAGLKRGGDVHASSRSTSRRRSTSCGREPRQGCDFEAYFHREWMRSLFGRRSGACASAVPRAARRARFASFERYDLEADEARPADVASSPRSGSAGDPGDQ